MSAASEKRSKEQSTSCKTIPVTNTTETAIDQFELETARQQKKRDLRMKQYSQYAKTMYGTPVEKEEVRKNHREALLNQIKQKDVDAKNMLTAKVKESETAVAYDKSCLEEDKQQHSKKANYLKQFRDGNKALIEMRSEEKKKQRDAENKKERELLKQNPVNWSNTLC